MSTQIILSDVLEDLSKEEQALLLGGKSKSDGLLLTPVLIPIPPPLLVSGIVVPI